jgi:hypothetical protein
MTQSDFIVRNWFFPEAVQQKINSTDGESPFRTKHEQTEKDSFFGAFASKI